MLEESDAGNYTCVATNVAGSDECSAPLTVRGQLKRQQNRGTWVAQLVKCLTLDLSSHHDFAVCEF